MRIEDFPRPKNDNGRGIHWSARIYHDAAVPSLDFWVDELTAMKIKWVKLLDDGGGSSINLCRKLLAADIMPIVRMYMAQLNPHRLSGRELDTVSRLVDIGVRYFESNNEPDLPAEWRDNRLPKDWLDIVVNNFIRDADAVLARGGLLALPAMGPGSRDNPISLVVQKGRKDLFENGCWVAIHNYTLNHPLDYPDDDVNQQGRPLTQAEYDQYAAWAYSHLTFEQIQAQGIPISASDYQKYQQWAWDGRSIEQINTLRATKKNPGATVYDDPNCFRGFEAAGKMIRDALGFYVPVISTEGGPVVGWGDDKRYAKVNPTTQAEWQLGIVRFMQTEAPTWYFAMCTWLIASRPLGDFSPTWEQMSWYTHAWDAQFALNGQLPIIQALKAEPTVIRPELQPGSGVLAGAVRGATGQPIAGAQLRLTGANRDVTTVTDEAGAYRFAGLATGVYSVLAGNVAVAQDVAVRDGETVTLDLTLESGQQSTISGVITDVNGRPQANAAVELQKGHTQVATAHSAADGRYRFEQLGAGSYLVSTAGASVAGIQLDGWSGQTVNLTVPAPAGFRYQVVTKRLLTKLETGNDRKFFGRVLDQAGLGMNGIMVEMAWDNAAPGAEFPRQKTPRDPFKPAGNFEFLHSPGEFLLRVVQGDWPSDEATGLKTSNVPGREGDPISYEVNFQLAATGSGTGTGSIEGVITNGAGLGLTLWMGSLSWAVVLPDSGRYRFEALPAGHYTLNLEGQGEVGAVDLAEGAAAAFNFTVTGGPQPTTGAVAGSVTLADGATPVAGAEVRLYQATLLAAAQTTDAGGGFRFESLPPGAYRVEVGAAGTLADNVTVIAGQTTTLALRLPPLAAGSTVHGRLSYSDGQPAAGLPVWATPVGGAAMPPVTTAADGAFTLERLAAGSYDLFTQHPQAGQVLLQSGLLLDGRSDVTVSYDTLTPLTGGEAKPLPTYLLFGSTRAAQLLFDLMLPYVRANSLTAGFDLEDAKLAAVVTIVGGEDMISAVGEQALRDAGCQVQRLPGDPFVLAETLHL